MNKIQELREMNILMKSLEQDIMEVEKFSEKLKEIAQKRKNWSSSTKSNRWIITTKPKSIMMKIWK